MQGQNILLTGIPRSGTTLATAMLDSLPDAVALNEPRWQFDWMVQSRAQGAADAVKWLTGDMAQIRHKLLAGEAVMDRRDAEGKAVTNYYRKPGDERAVEDQVSLQPVRRSLTADFRLTVKHVGPFLSLLPELCDSGLFTVLAILRNPVGVIASWRQVPIPLREGKFPGAALYWPEMRQLVASPLPLLEKQVRVYDLLCARLHAHRHRLALIKYEELTQEPGLLYDRFTPGFRSDKLKIKPRESAFYGEEAEAVRNAVLAYGQHYRHFYSPQEVATA